MERFSQCVIRFSVVRDPMTHFLSGLAETRFRSDKFCASRTAAQCTELARMGNSSQRPLLALNAFLNAQLPAHFFIWAARHMWLMTGTLVGANQQEIEPITLHLESFATEWNDFRSDPTILNFRPRPSSDRNIVRRHNTLPVETQRGKGSS